mgnify:CR=1 FL=1
MTVTSQGQLPRWHFQQAARALTLGGVIAYPTEAVWGVGCDPFNEDAVRRLLALKRRPMHKGVILIAADMQQIEPLLRNLSEEEIERISATWPGPNTWLLPDPDNLIPYWIKGKHSSVAVRVSDHPGVQALCREFGSPVVSTSANPAAFPPADSSLRVRTYFGHNLDYLLPGKLGGLDRPTQIRDLRDQRVIRA